MANPFFTLWFNYFIMQQYFIILRPFSIIALQSNDYTSERSL